MSNMYGALSFLTLMGGISNYSTEYDDDEYIDDFYNENMFDFDDNSDEEKGEIR